SRLLLRRGVFSHRPLAGGVHCPSCPQPIAGSRRQGPSSPHSNNPVPPYRDTTIVVPSSHHYLSPPLSSHAAPLLFFQAWRYLLPARPVPSRCHQPHAVQW